MKKIFLIYLASLLIFSACSDSKEPLNRKLLLSDGWKVQSSAVVKETGEALSSGTAATDDWYIAIVPSTVMGVLIGNGQYKGILEGIAYKEIDRKPFDVSWWYCKEFVMPMPEKGQYANLHFDGLSYSANVWLNGTQIASREELRGPFRQFSFDITPYLKEKNVLAVEVFRAQPGDPNIGFVDWNPRPADENMGIYREAYVTLSGKVEMKNTFVRSKVKTETLDEAWLTIETRLVNHSDRSVKGKLEGNLEELSFSIPVALKPGETKDIKITPDDVPGLHLLHPRLWWCANLGTPEMYMLNLDFKTGGKVSDAQQVPFGIREIKDYITKDNQRGFLLNGKKVQVRSAGWTDDIFLRNTSQSNKIQALYVKDMNLNSIRFENIWGTSQDIYNLCDRYGLLALVGWSCHWEWDNYLGSPCDEYGGIVTEDQMNLVSQSFRDQVLWLRNHPSIIAWYAGSDKIPRPALEKRYLDILKEIDDRPYVSAAKGVTSELTGSTGMKMNGPYEYVGPNYWYEDTKYGGAFGFNTETGIGAQLPVVESLRRMIPEDKLWPLNEYWDYHCTTSGAAMNSLKVLTETLERKYGKSTNLNDYLRKADLLNYEGTRTMFEAFRVNFPDATGIVQWMLNSAWPSLYWQMYDYYLIPTSAYYGVKKSNRPQQLVFNYKNNGIYLVKDDVAPVERKARIALYGLDSKLLQQAEIDFRVECDYSKKVFDLDSIASNEFLSLRLFDEKNELIADNFYCLSGSKDVYDWEKTDWIRTPIKSYADFKGLASIPSTALDVKTTVSPSGNELILHLQVFNPSSVLALMTRFVLKDTNGNVLYPVFWDDNYISFLPGENRTLSCRINKSLLARKIVRLYVSGWNQDEQELSLDHLFD